MNAAVETAEIERESANTLTVAKTFTIKNGGHFEQAGAMLKAVMALKKKIADTFDPHIKRAYDAHRSLVAEKRSHEMPLEDAEKALKRTMVNYQLAQEQERRQAEAKAQEEARREREKLEERAAKAAAAGKVERAEALQQSAAMVVTPILAPTMPKVAGISTRVTYKAVVADKLELVKAVAAGTVPLNALDANMAFLNNQARAMKETLAYPGVKVEQETGIASRSA